MPRQGVRHLEAAQLGHDGHDGGVARIALQSLAVAARVVHGRAHAAERRVAREVAVLVQLVDGLRASRAAPLCQLRHAWQVDGCKPRLTQAWRYPQLLHSHSV